MVSPADSYAARLPNDLLGKTAGHAPRWLSLPDRPPLPPVAGSYRIAVAVPARQEAARIGACLQALDRSAARVPGSTLRVMVLVNNSTDGTAAAARAVRVAHLEVRVAEAILHWPRAHAGMARRKALDLAADWLDEEADEGAGLLLTTDADSQVHEDWIAANLAEFATGVDAVAGAIAFLPGDALALPPVRQQEWHLATLQARLRTLLDPRPHDQWPTHIWAWGASFAVMLAAYRAVDGLPVVPLAEDRALADRLERHGFTVRRSFLPVVFTSARLRGRAPGGFADLLGQYLENDHAPCDAALEPTAALARRLLWRARLRRRHRAGETLLCPRSVRRLRLGLAARFRVAWAMRARPGAFGAVWHVVERHARPLARERLHPADLDGEIRRAQRLLGVMEGLRSRAGTRDGVAAE